MDIFKLVGSVFVDTDKANDSLSKTDKKASNVGSTLLKGVETAGKFAVGLTTACAAGATALVGMATKSAETADQVDKMSQKIGISKQGYQEWSYVLGQNGMDVDKLSVGMKTLVSQMDSAAGGTESAVENFKKLGVSIYDSNGKLKDQETMMKETLYKLADMENGTEKARLATELFGKAGIEMMPMLNQGSGAMEDLTKRAHELGLVLSDETVNAGVVLGDTMDDVKQSFGAIATKLGAQVMPIVQKGLDWILDKLPMIQGAFERFAPIAMGLLESLLPPLFELVQALFPVLLSLLGTLIPPAVQIVETIIPIFVDLLNMLLPPLMDIINMLLPILVQLLPPILSLLQPIINLLNPIIQLCMALLTPLLQLLDIILPPLIEIITFLTQVVLWRLQTTFQSVADIISNVVNIAVSYVKEQIAILKDIFGNVIEFIKNVFTGNWKAAFENVLNILSNIFQLMINRVKLPVNIIIGVINGMISGITSGINAVIGALNKLKIDVPDWVTDLTGVKDFGFNIKKIVAPQIPLLAKGANVLEGGRAVINEAGAELVDLPTGAKVMPLTSNGRDFLKIDILVKRIEQILELLTAYVPEIAANTKLKFVLPTGEIVEATLSRINNGLAEIEDITVRGGTI